METLTIDRLGHEGDGVALNPDGKAQFIRGTLPGDMITLTPEGWQLLAPGPDRVAPPCPHFGDRADGCGGCAVQHMADAALARWKAEQIAHALTSRGIDCPVGLITPTQTSPAGSRRRAVLTAEGGQIGFHAAGTHRLVPITHCTVLHPQIMQALPLLAALAAGLGGRVRLNVTTSETGLDVVLDCPKRPQLAQLPDGIARLSWGDETVLMARPPQQRLGRALVTPPPGGFLQATAEGAATLARLAQAGTQGAKRVIDLFAGSGTLSLPLAEQAEVHAVETDGAALRALDQGWRLASGLKRITTERRDLFRRPVTAAELNKFDAVVMDPPRAGASAQTEALAQSTVPRVVMMSCNPATFARDARCLLDGGYQILRVVPIDQFRWSPHVELAALLQRR